MTVDLSRLSGAGITARVERLLKELPNSHGNKYW